MPHSKSEDAKGANLLLKGVARILQLKGVALAADAQHNGRPRNVKLG